MLFKLGKSAARKAIIAAVSAGVLGTGAAMLLPLPAPAAAHEAVVYKDPACGCCQGWVSYLKRHGYKVTVVERQDMDQVKDHAGVPEGLRSCHTAEIDGYQVEGHVPVEAIDKLLAERPQVTGIASPGMPTGSPGMDGPKVPNTIISFGPVGQKTFGTY